MSKKFLAILAVIGLSLSFSGSANADCNGFYGAVRGGGFKPRVKSDTSFNLGKKSWFASAALGYRYDYIRAEVEFVYRDDAEEKVRVGSNTFTESLDAKSYMFNLYWDLSPYTWFTPYVSAGVGATSLEFVSKSARTGNTLLDLDHTNFTWSVGAGLSAKVTSRFNIDAGYRYYDMKKLRQGKVRMQEVYGGLRYVF